MNFNVVYKGSHYVGDGTYLKRTEDVPEDAHNTTPEHFASLFDNVITNGKEINAVGKSGKYVLYTDENGLSLVINEKLIRKISRSKKIHLYATAPRSVVAVSDKNHMLIGFVMPVRMTEQEIKIREDYEGM